MPITLTITEGLLSDEAQADAFAGLTDALLEVSELSGNPFMTANVVGSIHNLPTGHVLAAGKPVDAAFVELKLPMVALTTPEAKRAFLGKATDIVEKLPADGSSESISGRTSSMRQREVGALQVRAIAMQILVKRSQPAPPHKADVLA